LSNRSSADGTRTTAAEVVRHPGRAWEAVKALAGLDVQVIARELVPTTRALNADRQGVAERLAIVLSTGRDPVVHGRRGVSKRRTRPRISPRKLADEVSHATNYLSAMPRVWSLVQSWPVRRPRARLSG
jgi:hypothetical protein